MKLCADSCYIQFQCLCVSKCYFRFSSGNRRRRRRRRRRRKHLFFPDPHTDPLEHQKQTVSSLSRAPVFLLLCFINLSGFSEKQLPTSTYIVFFFFFFFSRLPDMVEKEKEKNKKKKTFWIFQTLIRQLYVSTTEPWNLGRGRGVGGIESERRSCQMR